MSKVVATYWNNSSTVKQRKSYAKNAKKNEHTTPKWFVFVVIASITFMLCLGINLRAFSEMSREINENIGLNTEIEQLQNENAAIENEIKSLTDDERTIEREARKIGMSRPNEKILIPVN